MLDDFFRHLFQQIAVVLFENLMRFVELILRNRHKNGCANDAKLGHAGRKGN